MDSTTITEPILGKNLSNKQRIIAFLAILVIYFFYCYNFMIDTFVRPTLIYTYKFSLAQASSVFAIMSFATIPGTILSGISATKFGKKRTLMGIAFCFSIMSLLPLIAPSSFSLWRISRFITGLALGGVFGTAIPLVTDLFDQQYRGKLVAICTSTFSIAMIFAGQLYRVVGDSHWKFLLFTAAIPPLLGIILVYFLVPSDYEYIKNLVNSNLKNNEKINYFEMYKGKYLFIGIGAILLSGINFTVYSGYSNNITIYLTKNLTLSSTIAGTIYSLQGIGQLIGYNFWGFISDKFGRKKPIIGLTLVPIFILCITKFNITTAIYLYIFAFLLGVSFGFSGAWGAYYTELFPEKFRTLSPGISFNGGRIISSISLPFIASISNTPYGLSGVFICVSVVSILGIIIWGLLPETLIKTS